MRERNNQQTVIIDFIVHQSGEKRMRVINTKCLQIFTAHGSSQGLCSTNNETSQINYIGK